jgi:hypothetical protein
MTIKKLTELANARAFADAWNNLDAADFIELLADDAVYENTYVFTPMEGKKAIAKYLRNKFKTLAGVSGGDFVTSRVSKTQHRRPCAILRQGELALEVVFEVEDGYIERVDL